MSSPLRDTRQSVTGPISSGHQVQEGAAHFPGGTASHTMFSRHDVSTLTLSQQQSLSELKKIEKLQIASDSTVDTSSGANSCIIDSRSITGASGSVSVNCGNPSPPPESTRNNCWRTISGCFRCVRNEPSSPVSESESEAEWVTELAQLRISQQKATKSNRFEDIQKNLKPVPVDVEEFHRLTATALSGEQGIIKFLAFRGALEAIHNTLDPNIPEHHMEVINEGDEFMCSERPPYYWFEFSITDGQQRKLDLLALFNIGDADANDGLWGEFFMLPSKIKIADMQSTGDAFSEISLNQNAPEFANHDSSVFSSEEIDDNVFFIEFPETQEQLPRLMSLALLSFYSAVQTNV